MVSAFVRSFSFDSIPATLLAYMLAQQLVGFGIEEADERQVPLHLHHSPDPARWWEPYLRLLAKRRDRIHARAPEFAPLRSRTR